MFCSLQIYVAFYSSPCYILAGYPVKTFRAWDCFVLFCFVFLCFVFTEIKVRQTVLQIHSSIISFKEEQHRPDSDSLRCTPIPTTAPP